MSAQCRASDIARWDSRQRECVEALVTTGTLTSPSPIHRGETWTTELSGIELPGLHLRLE